MARQYQPAPCAPGLNRDQVTPKSLPRARPLFRDDLSNLPDFLDGIAQRRGPDTTNWCVACDTTILARHDALLCSRHRVIRSSQRRAHNRRRQQGQTSANPPTSVPGASASTPPTPTANPTVVTSLAPITDSPHATRASNEDFFLTADRVVRIRAAMRSTEEALDRNMRAEAGEIDATPFDTAAEALDQTEALMRMLTIALRHSGMPRLNEGTPSPQSSGHNPPITWQGPVSTNQ